MPLVRVEVRNEYGLGAPELYTESNKEDPKLLLEGVAVAGLVGILRQLGDLAEFAAEVFHGLQEQVTTTSSRSHKLMGRVKRIEAALPQLENLVLAQSSHLHFAYTTGVNWRARVRLEQSHFIYSDLPRFMMESYEHCQGPPQLNLLDKFDPGGPGSCLKRYSDPSFFKRASTGSEVAYLDKVLKDKKGRKIKKRSSWQKIGGISRGRSLSNFSGRTQFTPLNVDGQTSPCQTVSTYDARKSDPGNQSISFYSRNISVDLDHVSRPSYSMQLDARKSDLGNQSMSFHSRNGSFDLDDVSRPSYSIQHEEQESKESHSFPSRMQNYGPHDYAFADEKGAVPYDDIRSSLSGEQTGPNSHYATWDEKLNIWELASMKYDHDETEETFSTNFNIGNEERTTQFEASKGYDHDDSLEAFPTNLDVENLGGTSFETSEGYDHGESLETFSSNLDLETEVTGAIQFESDGKMDIQLDNENFSMPVPDDIQLGHLESETVVQINAHPDYENLPVSISGDFQQDDVESETDHFMDALNTIESEYETDLECQIKQDVEQQSATDEEEINNGVGMLKVPHSFSHSPNAESLIATSSSLNNDTLGVKPSQVLPEICFAAYCSLDKVTSEDIANSDPFKSDIFLQPLQIGNDSPSPSSLSVVDSFENGDVLTSSNTKSVMTNVSPDSNQHATNTQVSPSDSKHHSDSSPDKVISEDITSSVPFESDVFSQPLQITNDSPSPSSLSIVDSLKNGDVLSSSNIKSFMTNASSDNHQHATNSQVSSTDPKQHGAVVRINDEITRNSSELKKPPPEPSSVNSIKFWTNGGLLGLEPSKPPDFSMLNVASQVSPKSRDNAVSTSTQKPHMREKCSKSVEEADILEYSASSLDDRKGSILAKKAQWESLSADLGVNLQKLSNSYNESYISNSQNDGFSQTSGTIQPVSPNLESTQTSLEKNNNSSRMFELGNRLLLNGFYRKQSLDKDENSNPASSQNNSSFEQKNCRNVEYQTFSARSKDMLGNGSPIMSPHSSPPLGHMKISFQPINGFEAPKLQLKLPDGNVSHESGRDLFPSFQLVPEPTIPSHDVGSDSDDDTFCRSSPYGSDCLSHQSDSNSEQWESSESPSSKDRELYDALRRISLTESVSTPWETGAPAQGETNNNCRPQISFAGNSVEHSQYGNLFDLPSLDTLRPSLKEELRNHCDSKDQAEPHCPQELTPSPPPVPPPQWRAMNPELELEEGRQGFTYENLGHTFDRKLGSTITQQPKPAPLTQEQIIDAAHTMNCTKKYMQKVTGEKGFGQAANGKHMEEKEDFLHQIRTKSFNLRRTVTTKPTVTTGTPTNVQVNAILEKANAIRQAVGSDAEDDNWSDT